MGVREVMTREFCGGCVDDGRQNKRSLIVDCPSSEISGGVNSGLIRCTCVPLEGSLGQRKFDAVADRTIEMPDGQDSRTAR